MGKPKKTKVDLNISHRSGLTFEKKLAIDGTERIFIDLKGNTYTTVGISKEELLPLVTFLKKTLSKVETILNEKAN